MLLQRVITALVLVSALLASLSWHQPWPFAMLTLFLMAAGGWEWGRLNSGRAGDSAGVMPWVLGLAVAVAGLVTMQTTWAQQAPMAVWWWASALWVVWGTWSLRQGPTRWQHVPVAVRWLIGGVVIWLAWLAVANARAVGINFLLSALCLVWMADVAAYFGGRAWGKKKLAPSISPGKSWAGVWSGMVGVALLAALWMVLDKNFKFDSASFYSVVYQASGLLGLGLALALMCGLSVMGDLIESLAKRAAGAKDSSRLLPGHGGVLDRVDALLPTLPAALALAALGAQR